MIQHTGIALEPYLKRLQVGQAGIRVDGRPSWTATTPSAPLGACNYYHALWRAAFSVVHL